MTVTAMPKVIRYDTLETFEEVDGLCLSLVKAEGEEDGFFAGLPCLHLLLNAHDGAYERVFSMSASEEDLAKAIGQGLTPALSIARAKWEEPARTSAPQHKCVIVPFLTRSKH